jgi:hypothetical protein
MSDGMDAFMPPHRANQSSSSTTSSSTATATMTSGSEDLDPVVARSREVLEMATVGDLLRVTAEAADGSGRDRADEDETRDALRWFVVKRVGMSTGGRQLVEGELEGKKAQILDQGGANQARIGISGALLDERTPLTRLKNVRDADKFKRAIKSYERRVERESDALTLVSSVDKALTLNGLEQAVKKNPRFWTEGDGAHSRRVIKDPTESATKMTGELLALKHGHRDVVLMQIVCDWTDALEDSVRAPFAAATLEDMLTQDASISMRLSEARYQVGEDKDGNPEFSNGITAVIYRETAKETANLLVSMGVQATRNIAGAFQQALVGVALGYTDENIAHHIRRLHNEDKLTDEDIFALIITARDEKEALNAK